jgi:hypothetical protein
MVANINDLIDQRVEITVYAIISAVQLMSDRNRAHATLTAILLDVTMEVPLRAEK